MKVILLRDVAKIGRRNDVVELPDGYAQNQLIPKKWAEAATPVNLKKISALNAAHTAHDEAEDARFESAATALGETRLIISGDANAKDHLFKAVHEADIVSAAAKKGIVIDKAWVQLQEQIKALGIFSVSLRRGKREQGFHVEVIRK